MIQQILVALEAISSSVSKGAQLDSKKWEADLLHSLRKTISLVLLLARLCLSNMIVTSAGQAQSFTVYLFHS